MSRGCYAENGPVELELNRGYRWCTRVQDIASAADVCVCFRWRTCCSPNSTSSARFTFQFNSSSPTFMRSNSDIARSRVSRSFRSTFLKASYRQSSSQLECVITRLRYYCARCTNLRGMIFVDFCSHKLFSGWRNGRAFARDPKGRGFESRPVRLQVTALAASCSHACASVTKQ